MIYATRQNMIDAFGEHEVLALTDRGNFGQIDDAVLCRALEQADAQIDGYLQGRYTLPLAVVPRLLAVYACDLARYRLTGGDATETEAVRNRYQDAIKGLSAIRDGQLNLGLDPAQQAAPEAGAVRVCAPVRAFGRDTLERY